MLGLHVGFRRGNGVCLAKKHGVLNLGIQSELVEPFSFLEKGHLLRATVLGKDEVRLGDLEFFHDLLVELELSIGVFGLGLFQGIDFP
jgi:hypothetical protein